MSKQCKQSKAMADDLCRQVCIHRVVDKGALRRTTEAADSTPKEHQRAQQISTELFNKQQK